MHRHAIIRRWADLDALNHVNNVRYVAWAKDALLVAQRDRYLPAGALWPTTITVTYRRPVLLGIEPIGIETTLGDDRVIRQVIVEDSGAERIEYATIETTLAPVPGAFADPVEVDQVYPLLVRHVETAPDGRVDYPQMFEHVQEARIFTLWKALGAVQAGSFVVGRVTLAFGSPLTWRPEPYPAHTWAGRLGRSSLDLVTQIRDGDRVLAQATAVMVGFDLQNQTARPFDPSERAAYETLMPAEVPHP